MYETVFHRQIFPPARHVNTGACAGSIIPIFCDGREVGRRNEKKKQVP
jgi:hypothetical protein